MSGDSSRNGPQDISLLPRRLAGKVALITGGASGIGAATVRRFVQEGASVVFSDLQDTLATALAEESGAMYVRQDVSDESAWRETVVVVQRQFGRLDVVMNNAGITGGHSIEETDLATWQRMIAVNLTGVMLGCKHGIALMRQNPDGPGGSLINMSSNAGLLGVDRDVAYTATKGAVRLLTKSVAVHCARSGLKIRCNSIHPGAVRTPIFNAVVQDALDPEAALSVFKNMSPFGRMGEPGEIAALAAYLASDESAFATGAEFVIDGGTTAGLPSV